MQYRMPYRTKKQCDGEEREEHQTEGYPGIQRDTKKLKYFCHSRSLKLSDSELFSFKVSQ